MVRGLSAKAAMKKTTHVEIASADDDMISSQLLKWSGLSDRWQRHELDNFYNFTSDVVEHCQHVFIERENWDGGLPGRSGVWHVVTTDNARALKSEIRARVSALIQESKESVKAYRQKLRENAAKIAQGPSSARLLFEADIWDDLSPTTYSLYIEEPNERQSSFRLWERCSRGWRLTGIQSPAPAGIKKAVQCMLLEYLGSPDKQTALSFRAGPIFSEEGLESLARPYTSDSSKGP